jgi:hypothetical protein
VGKIAKSGLTSELVVIHIGILWNVTQETSGYTNISSLGICLKRCARSLQMLQTPAPMQFFNTYLPAF